MAEFESEILHRLGPKHGNADALFRRPCRQFDVEERDQLVAAIKEVTEAPAVAPQEDLIADAQAHDPDLGLLKPWLEMNGVIHDLVQILYESEAVKTYWHQKDRLYLKDGVIHRKKPDGTEQVVIPKSLRQDFLKRTHSGITGGHLRVRRTKWQVRRRAYWVGSSKDVKRFCKCCPQCNQYPLLFSTSARSTPASSLR